MIKTLQKTTKYFSTQESEANTLITEVEEQTDGTIVKKLIDRKTHREYGDYFETTIVEEFTTSRSVLEKGF